VTESFARAGGITVANEAEAQALAESAAKLWSALQDCFVRALKWEAV